MEVTHVMPAPPVTMVNTGSAAEDRDAELPADQGPPNTSNC